MLQPRRTWLLGAVLLSLASTDLTAQSANTVAIVINDASADSIRIGEDYAQVRGLPPENVLRIKTSPDEGIARDEYVQTIEQPLATAIRRAGLQDRILYIVLTKGVPHRISGTTGLKGTAGSVDSELTLLYRRMTGQPVSTAGAVDNPYYLGARDVATARPFSHAEHDIYLVTRLDAFTTDEALKLVERAQRPVADGKIVLDQRAAGAGPTSGDEWMALAAKRLAQQGHGERVVLESTVKAARGVDPVLGYYAWGATDPENRVRKVWMAFTPGSIAANLASFDARTFRAPPDDWMPSVSSNKSAWFEGGSDNLIGDLIRDGATGVSGQVGEAYVLGAVRPEILFPAYLAGFNLAEAFYLASPVLSWQQVIVGDPLMAPFGRGRLTQDADSTSDPATGLRPVPTSDPRNPTSVPRNPTSDPQVPTSDPTAGPPPDPTSDPATGLPAHFARRRMAVAMAANPGQPEAAVAQLLRAEHLLARNDSTGASEALEKAIGLSPKSPGLLLLAADLEEKAADYDAAIARYRRVLEMQPANVIALNNLAYALAVRKNQPAEALTYARKAASLAPRVGSVLDTLGWVEHLVGNHDTAAKVLEDAVRLVPQDAEIRLHAAAAYATAGRLKEAEKALADALKLDASLESRDEVGQIRKLLVP